MAASKLLAMAILAFSTFCRLQPSIRLNAEELPKFSASNSTYIQDESQGLRIARFVEMFNVTLDRKPIEVFQGTTRKSCVLRCLGNIKCRSINLEKSTGRCELLSDVAFALRNRLQLTINHNFNHFTIKTPCLLFPCWPTGTKTCEPLYSQGHYQCICKSSFYGRLCKSHCGKPLGMEDGRILDSKISASSYMSNFSLPSYGRLNRTLGNGAWMAAHKTVGEYLQVDLDEDKLVSKVATQGRANTNEWVSQFMLKTRLDQKTTWVAYPYSSNRSTIFSGNNDNHSVVFNYLTVWTKARYVQFVVHQYNSHPSMRVEVYTTCT